MRFLSSLFLGLVAAILVLALAVFALQNLDGVPVHFLGYTGSGNVWWLVLAAAVLGFAVAFLLMLPGRVAASWRIQGLSRQMQRQDEELASVRQQQTDVETERSQFQQQYQQLQAQRDQLANERQNLIAERDRLAAERDRLLSERNQPSQPAQQRVDEPVMTQPQPAPAIVPGMAAAPYVDTQAQPSYAPERADVPREDREDVVLPSRPDPERIREAAENADTADGEQPSLVDRVRDFFRAPSEEAAPPPDQPSTDEDTTLPDNASPREDRPVGPPA
jgi:uncharacterized integral membrane protein